MSTSDASDASDWTDLKDVLDEGIKSYTEDGELIIYNSAKPSEFVASDVTMEVQP